MFSVFHENDLTVFRSPLIASKTNVNHVFSTRKGGVSSHPYHSLNLGKSSGDHPENVSANRHKFLTVVNADPAQLALGEQVHGSHIEIVESPGIFPETDALITSEKNIALGIMTADCTPVLMVDPERNVIAAVHAGWKGVRNTIIQRVVSALKGGFNTDPENILCAVGPSIRSCCYEVQEDVAGRFDDDFIIHRKSHLYLDLLNVILQQLTSEGLRQDNIEISDECTCCREDLFYSYRRDGARTGRMMMLAMLT